MAEFAAFLGGIRTAQFRLYARSAEMVGETITYKGMGQL
jgi:hypothetical protein